MKFYLLSGEIFNEFRFIYHVLYTGLHPGLNPDLLNFIFA